MNKHLKVRKKWIINPIEKVHSTKKGKKGYTRSENKRIERKESNDSDK